jgi:hypothetical protein
MPPERPFSAFNGGGAQNERGIKTRGQREQQRGKGISKKGICDGHFLSPKARILDKTR